MAQPIGAGKMPYGDFTPHLPRFQTAHRPHSGFTVQTVFDSVAFPLI